MTTGRHPVHVAVATPDLAERTLVARLLAAASNDYRFASGESVDAVAPFLHRDAHVCLLSTALPRWRELVHLADELGRPVPIVCFSTSAEPSDDLPASVVEALRPDELTTRDLERAIQHALAVASERSLRESENRFRLLAENASDIISRVTPEGHILYISPAARPFMGVDPDQAVGRSLFGGVHPDDVESMRGAMARSAAGEPDVRVSYRRRKTSGGEWCWFESASRGVFHPETGACLEIQSVTRDVTARKQAEQALRTSEERFRAIVEASPDSIAIIGIEGEFQFVGRSFLADFGYDADDFDKSAALDMVHDDDSHDVAETLARMIAEGPGSTGESTFRFHRANGEWSLVEARGTTLASPDGSVSGVVVVFRDVTLREEAERALRASEERYRDLFENATDILFTLDMEGKFTSANHAAEEAMGYDHWEILGMNVADVISPDHLPIALEIRAEALKFGQTAGSRELDLVAKDGTSVLLEIRVRALGDPSSRQGLQGMARDITARRGAEDLLRTVANSSPIGMYIVQDGAFAFVNPQFCRNTGYPEADLLGRDALSLVVSEFRTGARESAVRMLKGDHSQPSEFQVRTRSGEVLWFLETVNSISYQGRRAALGSIVDITARKQAEEQLHRQAFFDGLTGLPNRSNFMDRLEASLLRTRREAGSVATLFLDLDGFKNINDTFGHATGDALLGLVGQRLAACLRPGDIVARLGGDEFTVLVEGIKQERDALNVADRIMESFNSPFHLPAGEAHITASIGIAFNRGGDSGPGDILREADIALYHAKANGKARYSVFDPAQAA